MALWGCTEPATIRHASLVDPSLEPRDRCPKAILNPDTDQYDAAIASVIAAYQDLDAWGSWPEAGPVGEQRADVVDAFRLVRGTWARCESIDIKHRMQMQRDKASAKGKR